MKKSSFLIIVTILVMQVSAQNIHYPEAQKVDQVDDYHGNKVEDPYRWLEDENSQETKKWIEEENVISREYLEAIPFRTVIRDRLQELWNYERSGIPFKKGQWIFCFRNTGVQNQSVLYVKQGYDGKERVLLDPNKLSDGGTTSLADYSVSHDYKYLGYSTSVGGSDWNEIYVLDIATGKLLSDHIKWVKFSGISWYKDGFYYSSYDVKDESKALTTKNEYHKVYYHKLGTSQKSDVLIYENKEFPLRNYGVYTDRDEKYLFLSESASTSGNAFYFKSLERKKADWIKLADGFEFDYQIVSVIDDKFYLLTNDGAPNNQLFLVDPKKPSRDNWAVVIPEKEHVLESVNHIGGKFVVNYMEHASNKLYVYSLAGEKLKAIELPGIGTVGGPVGEPDEKEFFYSYTSYTVPSRIYTCNIDNIASKLYFAPSVQLNSDEYITTQVFYQSKDGTKVPMFITHKKDIELNGDCPVLLYGYGGFNISLTPSFRLTAIPFLEAGGIYVVANLRGGGEYGQEWHLAGTKQNKQNVFDDFIAAAEYLIENNYTNPKRIAIQGGSNGGLLVGACMTQRPDLFKVALPAVGVMDMLRFQKFTIGWAWTGDYGSSDNAEDFQYIYKYSPLHNIQEGVEYPATLVTTADHDDRVVPAHSFKFMATLQAKNRGDNPVLIRIETMAGHGAGKPTAKQIEEATDVMSFMMFNLRMEPAQ
jgi:prolyl oligopeptidase